ncbi:hypothetical protein HMPREF9062_1521 [Actinomyces sp. oral taxon 448 str. F0400]|nr:hypothetical protein HMPREF9062_1521 [Actinomyces sp. oral taxon 448 str. F0400]
MNGPVPVIETWSGHGLVGPVGRRAHRIRGEDEAQTASEPGCA